VLAADNALVGLAFGLGASVVANAAASAGGLIDATATSAVASQEPIFGSSGGPFARLYALAFSIAFLSSGAFIHVCSTFVRASSDAVWASGFLNPHGVIAVIRSSTVAAIELAGPALAAQCFGTIVAAVVARAASRINGMMLASPLVTGLVLASTCIAAPITISRLLTLAAAAAAGP